MELNANEWHYKSEGNANIVLQYVGEDELMVYRILDSALTKNIKRKGEF